MDVCFTRLEGAGLLVQIDLGVYSHAALLKAAYRFTDRCYLHLENHSPSLVVVRFSRKNESVDLERIAGEFCSELLDQTLREIVGKETEGERNLILAHALSRTTLDNPELEGEPPFLGNSKKEVGMGEASIRPAV
jgi:His-Xaa-Ser system protein HxsD